METVFLQLAEPSCCWEWEGFCLWLTKPCCSHALMLLGDPALVSPSGLPGETLKVLRRWLRLLN